MADEGAARPLRGGSDPEKIGRYRIVRRIGRGAMGVVYEAHDEVMGRRVGLKVLMADLEGDPDTLARFHREAKAAARLVHPNIITIFDAGEDKGRSFIAMQLLEGWPLADYLKRPEAAPLERKLDLMIQICEGLAAAHSQGVIHRDLKPNNLFVQTDGPLKIYDFGVARLAESNMTAVGTMIGTPDYMSPEQARGSQVDARSDIFSTGSVFYSILSGRKPFHGSDLPAVLNQLQFAEPAALDASTVPAELAAVVQRAMAKRPEDRPQRIEELLDGLHRVRRHYLSETRRLAATVDARFEIVEKLAETVATEASTLGLPADTGAPSPAQRFPMIAGRGVDALSFDREAITTLLHDLETERLRLAALLDSHRAHAAHLDSGKAKLASGDAIGALKQFELVTAAYPTATVPRELADGCRTLAREQEVRNRAVAELTAAARRSVDTGDLTGAIGLCDEALELWPGHELASRLRAEAQDAIAREARRQDILFQRLIDHAGRAIEQSDFAAAAAALREAELLKADAPAIGDLRRRLTDAEAAAEAARLLEEMSVDEIRLARAVFRRGRYDEAVQQLRAFLDAEPDATQATAELNRLVRLRERQASAASARQAKVAGLLSSARSAADQQLLTEALGLVRQALRANPADPGAAALFDELMDRDLKQRIAAARARTAEDRAAEAAPLLAAAREAIARGYLAVGRDAAVAACRVAPEWADAAALAEEIRVAMAAEDLEAATIADAPFAESQAPAPTPAVAPTQAATQPMPAAHSLPKPTPPKGVLDEVGGWLSAVFRQIGQWFSGLFASGSAKK